MGRLAYQQLWKCLRPTGHRNWGLFLSHNLLFTMARKLGLRVHGFCGKVVVIPYLWTTHRYQGTCGYRIAIWSQCGICSNLRLKHQVCGRFGFIPTLVDPELERTSARESDLNRLHFLSFAKVISLLHIKKYARLLVALLPFLFSCCGEQFEWSLTLATHQHPVVFVFYLALLTWEYSLTARFRLNIAALLLFLFRRQKLLGIQVLFLFCLFIYCCINKIYAILLVIEGGGAYEVLHFTFPAIFIILHRIHKITSGEFIQILRQAGAVVVFLAASHRYQFSHWPKCPSDLGIGIIFVESLWSFWKWSTEPPISCTHFIIY